MKREALDKSLDSNKNSSKLRIAKDGNGKGKGRVGKDKCQGGFIYYDLLQRAIRWLCEPGGNWQLRTLVHHLTCVHLAHTGDVMDKRI